MRKIITVIIICKETCGGQKQMDDVASNEKKELP